MNPGVEVRLRRLSRARDRSARAALGTAAVVAAAIALTQATLLLDDPAHVERVLIDNPSEYDIDVALASVGGGGSLPLGAAAQRCHTGYHEVIDQGATWVVAFRAQGADGGQVVLTREDLARRGWELRIPDEVVARLRGSAAPASPVRSCAP